jgi:hypothetical protein
MSETIEQQAAPDPATTAWVPVGPGGIGTPTPVVNGKWVKGVGGAAVWSAIADADVPSLVSGQRLGTSPKVVTDANLAIDNGWYYMASGGANAPPGSDYFALSVQQVNVPGNLRQTAYAYSTDTVWMRRFQDGATWSPWILHQPVAGVVNTNGTILAGHGFTVTHPQTGLYQVTLNPASVYGYPVVALTPTASSTVACAQIVSGAVFNVFMTTPSAYVDSGFSFVVYASG